MLSLGAKERSENGEIGICGRNMSVKIVEKTTMDGERGERKREKRFAQGGGEHNGRDLGHRT